MSRVAELAVVVATATILQPAAEFRDMNLRALLAIVGFASGCDEKASDVLGRSYFQYVERAEQQPRDLTGLKFRAYVPQSASTFLIYPAVSGTRTGTFTIPGVQEGTLLLQVSDEQRTTWSEHETHDIEFVTPVLGRPNGVTPLLATPFAVRADGLDAWNEADQLYIDCWTNGTEHSGLQARLTPSPLAGQTVLDGQFDWNSPFAYSFGPDARPYLMEDGDSVTISRTRGEQVAGLSIQSLTQIASGTATTQIDGQSGGLSTTFVNLPQDKPVHIMADLPSMRQQLSGSSNAGWLLTLLRGPGAARGLRMGPPLLEINSENFDSPLDLSRSIADPFDPSWDLVLRFYYEHRRSLQVPGLPAAEFREWISLQGPAIIPDHAISSPIGVLAELSINGVRVEDGVTIPWDGASSLTFQAAVPVGLEGFAVSVLRVTDTTSTEVVHLRSLHDSITIPPDGFALGQPYVLLATLSYASGETVAVSQAVWGPVTLTRL